MTETIEQKALALVNDACKSDFKDLGSTYRNNLLDALLLAVEQHEAFRQEVSDAVAAALDCGDVERLRREGILSRFVIAKPDPLVEVMQEWWDADGYASIETFRAALAARGLAIVKKEPSQ